MSYPSAGGYQGHVAVSPCRFGCWFPHTGDSRLRTVLILKMPIPDGGWCRPWRVLVLGLLLVALQKWLGWCPNAPLWQWLLWCALPETSQSSTVLDLELHSAVAWWCGAYVKLRQRPCWSWVGCNRSVSRCLGISDSPVRWWWWEVVFRKIIFSESQIGGQWVWSRCDIRLRQMMCSIIFEQMHVSETSPGWKWDTNIRTWIEVEHNMAVVGTLIWVPVWGWEVNMGTWMDLRCELDGGEMRIYGPWWRWGG